MVQSCRILVLFSTLFLTSCGDDSSTPWPDTVRLPDAGAVDTTSADSAVPDAPVPDVAPDSLQTDAAPVDAAPCPCTSTSCQDKKIVFVTSITYNGAMGGLAGADQACNNLASSAGLQGGFTAWLSDSSTDAKDRVLGGPWYTVQNDLVACDIAELTTSGTKIPINLTEKGGASPQPLVWTGTSTDGTKDPLTNHDICTDWTSSVASPEAYVGRSDMPGTAFTTWQTGYCSHTLPLYCFQTSP